MEKRNCAHGSETLFQKSYSGINFAFLDGSVDFWLPRATKQLPSAAFTIDDGEVVNFDTSGIPFVEIKYGAYLSIVVYVFLIVLPAFFTRQQQLGSAGKMKSENK